ncbi:hypothetical protein B0H13DRAFT_2513053 [Mycena leptocephala]|nr:hypothetical protein B0H13DRAFT_2513053 [Mycena leptocephala]
MSKALGSTPTSPALRSQKPPSESTPPLRSSSTIKAEQNKGILIRNPTASVSTSTPVLELPYELTTKIFIYCLPFHRRVRPEPTQAPLQLSQICNHWRAVALATPELWSSILLEFPNATFSPDADPIPDHRCDLFDLWLTRAGNYPLSITTILPDPGSCVPEKFFNLMAGHSHHWGRIELEMAERDLVNLNKIRGPFPMLHSFAICVPWNRDTSFPAESTLNAVLAAQNLQALHLAEGFSQIMSSPHVSKLPASLKALRAVHLRSPSPLEGFISILQRFPQILHLGVQVDSILMTTSPQTVIPYLKSLILGGSCAFLSLIGIPTLEHLQVSLMKPHDATALAGFLSGSARHLKYLSIELKNDIVHEFTMCLSLLQCLVTLQLVCIKEFEKPVTPRYGDLQCKELLPRLQTLLLSHHFYDSCYTSFLAVLHARPGLEHAVLEIPTERDIPPPPSEVLSGFKMLTSQGREIRITTPTYAWPRRIRLPEAVGILGAPPTLHKNSPDSDPATVDYAVLGFDGRINRVAPYCFSPFYTFRIDFMV